VKKIAPSVAAEHLKDGIDNISECMKTIHRVGKSYPLLNEELAQASAQLSGARTTLLDAKAKLPEA
jgi:hypothetical protein